MLSPPSVHISTCPVCTVHYSTHPLTDLKVVDPKGNCLYGDEKAKDYLELSISRIGQIRRGEEYPRLENVDDLYKAICVPSCLPKPESVQQQQQECSHRDEDAPKPQGDRASSEDRDGDGRADGLLDVRP